MRKRKHIIFALVALLCQNDILCVASRCKRAEDINPPNCNIEDLSNKVLIGMCKTAGLPMQPGITRNEIISTAKACYSIWGDFNDKDEIDDLQDKELIDMCKGTDFTIPQNPTREQLVQSARFCRQLASGNMYGENELPIQVREKIAKLPKWEKRRPGYDRQMKIYLKDGKVCMSQYDSASHKWSYPLEITDEMYENGADGVEGRDIHSLVQKTIQYDHALTFSLGLREGGAQNVVIGCNDGDDLLDVAHGAIDEYMLDKNDMVYLNRIAYFLEDQLGNRTKPTPEEIARLPQWEMKKGIGYDTQMKIFQKDGDAILAIWFDDTAKWEDHLIIADKIYKDGFDGWDMKDFVRKSGWYDTVVPTAFGLGYPSQDRRMKTGGNEQKILLGYNKGDDIASLTRDTLVKYNLNLKNSELDYIIQHVESAIGSTQDGTSQRTTVSDKMNLFEIFGYFFDIFGYISIGLLYVGFLLLVNWFVAGKKARKPAPRKSPLSCHRPKMKKTVYVKLFASKNLNGKQGRRLTGIISKSGVQHIELEKKTGQPTVMYKIEASNGVIYVPVHIKGSEGAVQKAIVLIQEAVGKANVDMEIELPPTKPKQAPASSSKISSSAPPKIPKKKKSTDRSFLSSIWPTACASCQSLRTMTINTCKSAINYIGKGTVITVAVLYSVLLMILLPGHYQRYSEDKYYQPSSKVVFGGLVLGFLICSAVVLVFRIIAYGLSMMLKYDARMTKSLIIIFGILCCMTCLVIRWACGNIERHYIEYRAAFEDTIFESISVCQPVQNYILILLPVLLFLSGMILLILRGVAYGISFIAGILRMPLKLYQTKKIKEMVYIKINRSKILSGKQGRKKKEIIKKSGVDDIQIGDTSAVSDNYIPIDVSGSRRSVWKAIEMIQEAIGTNHVSTTKPSNTMSIRESVSSTVNGSESQLNQEEPSTPEFPVQREIINNSGNNLAKEVSPTETSPAEPQEEKIPSEIGIDSSQGMTRETITEASISSLNDRSSISKEYSNFTLDENDPLFIFLRSQQSCIKGSVEEFYTWLVQSEDIDSMMALKEAVNEDDYLFNDMKVGDGGGSGIKGFKRKAFLRAISEYFNDKSDTKSTAEVHQSLPQCQKKNLSDTLEPPEELVCPISLVLMTNEPVLAADGITYERASIEDWFEKSKAKISKARENLKQNPQSGADHRVVNNGVCSPILGAKMENLTLMPHIGTRNMARSFEEKQKKISP